MVLGGFTNLFVICFLSACKLFIYLLYIKEKKLLKTNEEDKEDGHCSLVVQGTQKRLNNNPPPPIHPPGPKICTSTYNNCEVSLLGKLFIYFKMMLRSITKVLTRRDIHPMRSSCSWKVPAHNLIQKYSFWFYDIWSRKWAIWIFRESMHCILAEVISRLSKNGGYGSGKPKWNLNLIFAIN